MIIKKFENKANRIRTKLYKNYEKLQEQTEQTFRDLVKEICLANNLNFYNPMWESCYFYPQGIDHNDEDKQIVIEFITELHEDLDDEIVRMEYLWFENGEWKA